MLIFMTIQLKQFLVALIKDPSILSPELVRHSIMKKLKYLKFGLNMLHPSDFHIKQVAVSLGAVYRYGKDIMEFFGFKEDFKKVTELINLEFDDSMLPLDERIFKCDHGSVLNLE